MDKTTTFQKITIFNRWIHIGKKVTNRKYSKSLLPSSIMATCSAHLNLLGLITLTSLGERYKLWSSSWKDFFLRTIFPVPLFIRTFFSPIHCFYFTNYIPLPLCSEKCDTADSFSRLFWISILLWSHLFSNCSSFFKYISFRRCTWARQSRPLPWP